MSSWPSNANLVPAHAARHRAGGADEVATETPGADAIPRTGSSGVLNDWLTAALKAIGALTPASNKLAYFTSGSAAALANVGSTGLDVLAAGSQSAARTAIGAEASGTAASAVGTHEAASDPHPGYAKEASLEVPVTLVLGSTVSDSASAGFVTATGLSFTPVAGGIYFVQVFGVFSAAANTTGLRFLIDVGNAANGGGQFTARGANSTSAATLIGFTDNTNGVLGTSSPTTAGNHCGFTGFAVVTAHASSPTEVSLKFQSEVASSQVTLTAGTVVMMYRRLA